MIRDYPFMLLIRTVCLCTMLLIFSACSSMAKTKAIGSVDYNFRVFGPDDKIIVEAFDDPQIENVSLYISRANTGGFLGAIGVAEDIASMALTCQQTGPVVLPEKVRRGKTDGKKLFEKDTSLLFKTLQVVRFYDKQRHALVYLAYSDKVLTGSPNSGICSVPILEWPGNELM